jgi:hypothetical protein
VHESKLVSEFIAKKGFTRAGYASDEQLYDWRHSIKTCPGIVDDIRRISFTIRQPTAILLRSCEAGKPS